MCVGIKISAEWENNGDATDHWVMSVYFMNEFIARRSSIEYYVY